jgi:hypothetical protein
MKAASGGGAERDPSGRPTPTVYFRWVTRYGEKALQQWFVQVGYTWVSPYPEFKGGIDPSTVGEWRDVPTEDLRA